MRTISQSLRKDNGGDNSGFIGVSGSYTEKSSTGITTKYEATIKNIYFEDIEINGKTNVAGVVGQITGTTTITSVAVVGEIYGSSRVLGIAGYSTNASYVKITDCLVDVSPSTIVIRNSSCNVTATNSVNMSKGYLEVTDGDFKNWAKVTGMKYPMLPKGLSWLAVGSGRLSDDLVKLMKATNLIGNGNMEGDGWRGGSYSTDHAYLGETSYKVTGSTSVAETLIYTQTTIALDPTHIYYACIYGYQEEKVGTETVQCYWPEAEPAFGGAIETGELNQWNLYSWRTGRTSFTNTADEFRFDYDNRNCATSIYFDNAKLIDLTAIFGAGNEPDKAWLDQYVQFIATT